MKKSISEDMLIRHLLGESTADEEQAINVWMKASSANAQKLEQFKFILEGSKQLAKDSPADEEDQWEKFKVRRDSNRHTGTVSALKPNKQWLQTAASILLVCGLAIGGYYYFSRNSATVNKLVIIKTQNNVLTDTLPDGSIIQLNKYSAITYVNNFKKQRAIKLTGEAFFTVIHNADIPFNVQAGNVTIRDVGTSFNVKIKPDYLEVIVETGIVKVSRHAESIVLKQRDMIRISPTDQNLTRQTSEDLLYNYYRNNQFELNNTPLWRIVAVFNEVYDAHIRIEGQDLSSLPLTVTLKKDSMINMLHVLLLTTPELKMKKRGDEIILTK